MEGDLLGFRVGFEEVGGGNIISSVDGDVGRAVGYRVGRRVGRRDGGREGLFVGASVGLGGADSESLDGPPSCDII